MQLTKYRAFGKSRFIQMAVSLLSMLIYWGFSSGIFEILFNYNESSIDYNAQKAEQVRHDMLESSMYLSEYMNIQGYTTTIMFILMLAVLILFYQEKNGLFTFRYVRGESQKKVILSTIFQYSWINALWYYIIYIIYLSIGYCIMGNRMEYIPRNTFDGIFGEGFSAASPYLYYMVQGISSILIGTFIYTLFGCVIALYCKKSYQALLWMLGYFWGTQILLEFFRCTFLKQQAGLAWFIGKFEPTFLYGFYGYVYHNPTIRTALQTMDSLILPVLLSCVLLIIFFRKEEKINA